jgi:hypothetical protein
MIKSQGIKWNEEAGDQPEVCKDNAKKQLTIGWFNQTLDHFSDDGAKSDVAKNGVWQQVTI